MVEELLKYTKKSFRLEVLPVDSEVLLWGGATQANEEYVVGVLGQSTPQLVGTEAMTAVVRANRANSTNLANRLSCTERY